MHQTLTNDRILKRMNPAEYVSIDALSHTFEKRLNSFKQGYRQNLGLIGPKKIGKSTFLQQYFIHYPCDDLLVIDFPVYRQSFPAFVNRYVSNIVETLAKKEIDTQEKTHEDLLEWVEKKWPKTAEALLAVLSATKKGQLEEAFRHLLNVTLVLGEELNQRIVIIYEHFDRFDQWDLKDPFESFGRAIMVQNQTLFIVTGILCEKVTSIFREKLPLLFGNFEVIEVEGIPFSKAMHWVDTQLSQFQTVKGVSSFFVTLCNGSPFYLRRLLNATKTFCLFHDVTVIDRTIISEVLNAELKEVDGYLNQYFQNYMTALIKNRSDAYLYEILLEIVKGNKKPNQIAAVLGRKLTEVKKWMNRLLEEGVISKCGKLYYIRDYLFRFWLRYIYSEWHLGRLENERNLEAIVSSLMESIEDHSRMDLTLRVERLFQLFRNEVVDLGKTRIQCPAFSQIVAKPSNGRVFPIVAKSSRSRWLCQVAREKVSEEDIRQFADNSKKSKEIASRRVMISPRGIDLNAKLLAKEEKIAVWGLEDLNQMLDIYDLPKVLV